MDENPHLLVVFIFYTCYFRPWCDVRRLRSRRRRSLASALAVQTHLAVPNAFRSSAKGTEVLLGLSHLDGEPWKEKWWAVPSLGLHPLCA